MIYGSAALSEQLDAHLARMAADREAAAAANARMMAKMAAEVSGADEQAIGATSSGATVRPWIGS